MLSSLGSAEKVTKSQIIFTSPKAKEKYIGNQIVGGMGIPASSKIVFHSRHLRHQSASFLSGLLEKLAL
jgi:hypothetical protein